MIKRPKRLKNKQLIEDIHKYRDFVLRGGTIPPEQIIEMCMYFMTEDEIKEMLYWNGVPTPFDEDGQNFENK